MGEHESAYRGCLLGLAVGDAMGCTVDKKTYEEICRDYGPNGLLGYDLVNGKAEVSSHTQVAAFVCNGLLIGLTRGRSSPYFKYIALALREWAQSQRYQRFPDRTRCWVCQVNELRSRSCMDARMLDNLSRGAVGTLEAPSNQLDASGSLIAGASVGLFFHPQRMQVQDIGVLGAQAVALTHGDPMAFLSGATLSYIIAGILQDPETPLEEHFNHAANAVVTQFGKEYPQAQGLKNLLSRTITLAKHANLTTPEIMDQLECDSASQVLAGAVFACLVSEGDFDRAIIAAVNHSGRSAAVGAVTGAILGAVLGEIALPDFYLECLEAGDALRELADDLVQGCPAGSVTRLFDDEWDRKYIQGERVEKTGWAQL